MPGKLTFKLRFEVDAQGVEAHDVFQGDEFIGIVSRHPGTRKWAATWNMIPRHSDSFPFESKLDATDRLVAQANNLRR